MGKIVDMIRSLNISKAPLPKDAKDNIDSLCKKMSLKEKWEEIIPLSSVQAGAPEFPASEVPDAILDAAKEVSRFVKVSVISPIIVAIATISVAVGKKVGVYEREGLMHYAALFFTIVAPSGERKSAVFKIVVKSLIDWLNTNIDEHEVLKQKAIIINKLINKKISIANKGLEEDASNADDVAKEIIELKEKTVQIPPTPSLFTTDCTEQRLFQKMDERNGCYAVMSAEGRPVYTSIIGHNSKTGTNGDSIYLAGISGDMITRDRVGGEDGPEERVITAPCLNVCVMVQPDLFNRALINDGLNSSGAIARIWPVSPPSLIGSRLEEKDEPGLKQDMLIPFYNLTSKLLDARSDKEACIPHFSKLSEEASEARRIFSNKIEEKMAPGEAYEYARDIASKSVSQTCKLAIIFHMAKYPHLIEDDESTIDIDTWRSAEKIGEWFLNTAVAFKAHSKANKPIYDAYRVLEWINESWNKYHINHRTLMQRGPSPRFGSANDAKKVLNTLADHNLLKKTEIKGEKVDTYLINPLCFTNLESLMTEPV